MAIFDPDELRQQLRLQLIANTERYRQQLLQRLLALPDSKNTLKPFTES